MMYSDEQIRQIIFDLRDENKASDALAQIKATIDTRFLTVAIEILHDSIDEDYSLAYLTIQNLIAADVTVILQAVLPFMEHPIHGEWAIRRAAGLDINIVHLLPRFTNHHDADVRYTAIWAIDGLGHPNRLDIALYMLNDEDAKIRAKACRILSMQGYSDAVDSLIARLNDNEIGMFERPVSADAATALGKIGDERGIIPLQDVVRFGGESLACAALRALDLIDAQASEDFFLEQIHHQYESLRIELVQFIGSLGSAHVDTLISISQKDSSYYVQKEAAYRLSFMGTPESIAAAIHWETHYKRDEEDDELP